MKKFYSCLLVMLGIAATVGAAERVVLQASVLGGENASIAVENQSATLSVGKATSSKRFACKLPLILDLDDKGCGEVEFTLKVSGNGKFQLLATGQSELGANKKRSLMWVDCIALEVNGQKLIPAGKRKMLVIRQRFLPATIKLEGEQTVAVKASFVKTPEARAAKMNESNKKRAEKAKAKKAQSDQD